jgi:hypothetical protein
MTSGKKVSELPFAVSIFQLRFVWCLPYSCLIRSFADPAFPHRTNQVNTAYVIAIA